MMKVITVLEKIGKPVWIMGGLLLLCGVGFLDYITGYELSFSLFYLIPIALLTWTTNEKAGIVMSCISAGIWLVADISSGAHYSDPAIYFWNAVVRLGFFLLTVLLLKTGKTLELEKVSARTDYLTGAINNRFFHELAQREIDRSARYQRPLTVAFIDVDNFKAVNDQFGHSIGDRVLEVIAHTMRQHLRKTDIVARVGGDEFAILLPEIGADDAPKLISKMQQILLEKMQKNKWAVTFSIGVLTLNSPPGSVDEMLDMADKEMYSVKNSGKNNICYAVYTDKSSAERERRLIVEK
jgi:diguanylate cyclase (GGDEF)-like protein